MMGYTSIALVVLLVLGTLMLPAPTLSQKAIQLELKPAPCHHTAIERIAPGGCVGPSCQPCSGTCRTRCEQNETIGLGYCPKECQCCQPERPPCLDAAPCGSGGKCRRGNICPKGEKPISGRCGSTKSCICCASIQTTDGCMLEGELYPTGTVFYKNCMKFSCENNKWISSNQYSALCTPCRASNDPHFNTFDLLLFDWHGHSTYVLSQVGCDLCPDIFVYNSFDSCYTGSSITCVGTVYFQPEPGTYITIERASPLINSPITIGSYVQTLNGVVAGELLVLKGDGGVEHPAFAWMHGSCIHVMGFKDEGYLVKICSSSTTVFAYFTMQDNLCGLCGNWDGDKYNDLRYRDETIEPPPNQIGTSYSDRIVDDSYGNDWEVQDCPGNTVDRPQPVNKEENPCFKDGALQKYYSQCYLLIYGNGDPAELNEFLYDCMFDQCVATESGRRGLPELWLEQTEMLIKEDIQQKEDTVIYPEGCQGKCTTRKGSGYCKQNCSRGEEHLGSCPGGKCSCCKPNITPVCSGICTIKDGQRGYCSRTCYQTPVAEPESRLSLVPVQTCSRGCTCCPFRQG